MNWDGSPAPRCPGTPRTPRKHPERLFFERPQGQDVVQRVLQRRRSRRKRAGRGAWRSVTSVGGKGQVMVTVKSSPVNVVGVKGND